MPINFLMLSRDALWLRSARREHLVAAGFLLVTLLASAAAPNPPRYVEGELLVKFRGGPRGEQALQAERAFQHKVKRHFDHLGWQHIQLPAGQQVAEMLERYRRHPDLLAVEPNYLLGVVAMGDCPQLLPNDPRFSEQWALAQIGATNAWATTTGSSNVVVAVIDSGVNYNHQDLAANMWRNPGEIPGNDLDDDGNGYTNDVYGIDVVAPDSDPKDGMWSLYFHGTYCAGIIGAAGNNVRGIAGVNWSVQLMALRFLSQSGQGITSAMFVETCNYVLDQKSRGVNIRATSSSWGFDTSYPGEAVRSAIDSLGNAGILNAFAAGLRYEGGVHGTNLDVACPTSPIYPQCWHLPGVLNVAASDANDQVLTNVSNWGVTTVDLAAPGARILTTDGIANDGYAYGPDGTSMACPFVAGAAALLAGAYPAATLGQLKTALMESVDVVGDLTNRVASGGRLNVARAIQHPILASNAPPFITVHPRSQTNGLGHCVTFCVTVTGTNLNYQWQFNRTNLINDGRVGGSTTATLSLCNAQTNDAGDYAVVITNSFGMTTSVVARLTVAICPVVLAQPQSRQVFDNTNVLLNVVAAGAVPLAYQWQRHGVDIPNATGPALALPDVCPIDSGAYQVVVSNACNVVTSEVATVTVLGRPWIVAQPQSQTVTQGANVTLSVTVTNCASFPLGVAWRHFTTTRGWTVVSNGFTASTNLLNVQPAAAGLWTVRITNAATAASQTMAGSNAYLTVVAPPTNQTVCAGSPVRFSATAVGTNLSYQWQFKGTNLTNGGRISGATTTNLLLANVLPSDAGDYTFVVTNAVKDATGFPTRLDVLPRQPTVRLVSCPESPSQLCLEICWPDDDLNCLVQWTGDLAESWQPWAGTIQVEPCRKCVRIPVIQDTKFFRLKCGSSSSQ